MKTAAMSVLCILCALTARCQYSDEDCDYKTDVIINLAAGFPWNSYAEAGARKSRVGLFVGYMSFITPVPGKEKTKEQEFNSTSGIYIRPTYTFFLYDTRSGIVFRGYLTGLISNRFIGSSVRFGVSTVDDNIMLYVEPEYLRSFQYPNGKPFYAAVGLSLRF